MLPIHSWASSIFQALHAGRCPAVQACFWHATEQYLVSTSAKARRSKRSLLSQVCHTSEDVYRSHVLDDVQTWCLGFLGAATEGYNKLNNDYAPASCTGLETGYEDLISTRVLRWLRCCLNFQVPCDIAYALCMQRPPIGDVQPQFTVATPTGLYGRASYGFHCCFHFTAGFHLPLHSSLLWSRGHAESRLSPV